MQVQKVFANEGPWLLRRRAFRPTRARLTDGRMQQKGRRKGRANARANVELSIVRHVTIRTLSSTVSALHSALGTAGGRRSILFFFFFFFCDSDPSLFWDWIWKLLRLVPEAARWV